MRNHAVTIIVVAVLALVAGGAVVWAVMSVRAVEERSEQLEQQHVQQREADLELVAALNRQLTGIQKTADGMATDQRAFQRKWWNDRCDTSGLPADPAIVMEKALARRRGSELVGERKRFRGVGGK